MITKKDIGKEAVCILIHNAGPILGTKMIVTAEMVAKNPHCWAVKDSTLLPKSF